MSIFYEVHRDYSARINTFEFIFLSWTLNSLYLLFYKSFSTFIIAKVLSSMNESSVVLLLMFNLLIMSHIFLTLHISYKFILQTIKLKSNKQGQLWWHTSAAEKSYLTSEVRGGGQEKLPHTQVHEQRPGGATPRPT